MREFILIFLLFCISYGLKARDLAKPEMEKIDSILDLSYQAVLEVKADSSLKYALEALSLSEEINYSAGKSKANFYTGQALYDLGDYKNALIYLAASEIDEYSSGSPLILAEIHRVRGRVYGSMGLNATSIREFRNGLEHINKIEIKANRDYLTSLAYDNLTNIFKISGIYDSVYYYIQKNRALLQQMDESFIFRTWINLYGNLGEYYSRQEKYDSAVFYFNQSLQLSKKYEYPYTSIVYQYLGDMEFERANLDSSIVYYTQALENLEATNLKNELPAIYGKISEAYTEKGMLDSAKYYGDKALLIENELSKTKIDAADYALDMIVKRERENQAQENRGVIARIVVSFLLLGGMSLIYHLFWRRKNRKLMIRKEQEALEMKGKLNESFDSVYLLAQRNDPAFLPRFQELYPEFTKNLLEKHPCIVTSELCFCAMIFLNFSSKEIAQYTFIEHRSVQTKKSRLRKKLHVPSDVDLYHYLKALA